MSNRIFWDDADKEAYDWAVKRGIKIPQYRAFGKTFDGKDFSRVDEFSPAQFRRITQAPFPECCTPRNLAWLIELWNKEANCNNFFYELM